MRAVFVALVGACLLASAVTQAASLRRVPSRRLQTYTGTGTVGDSFSGTPSDSDPLTYEFTGLSGSNLPAQVRVVPKTSNDDPDVRISCNSNPTWDDYVASSFSSSGVTERIEIPADFNDDSGTNVFRDCPDSTAFVMIKGFGTGPANFDLYFELPSDSTDDNNNNNPFQNDFVLNDDNVRTAAAGLAAGIIAVIVIANVIFWTALICIIYHCCCKTRQPQTVIVTQGAPVSQQNPVVGKPV